MCSIEWRVRLLNRGLRDPAEEVKKEARLLVSHWLNHECCGDPVQLLDLLDPALHTGVRGLEDRLDLSVSDALEACT